jgi:hypothetical protein
VASNATTDHNPPEQEDREAGGDMNQEAQKDMQMDQEALATVGPVGIMPPFENQQDQAGGNGHKMPDRQAIKGGPQHDAAKHNAGHGNMGRPHNDAQPSHAVREMPMLSVVIFLNCHGFPPRGERMKKLNVQRSTLNVQHPGKRRLRFKDGILF